MQVDKPAKPTLIRQKKGKIKAKSQFFRTARYGLTLQEHRIVYFAILRGQQLKRPFEPVTISIKEFMALCDLRVNLPIACCETSQRSCYHVYSR